MIRIASPLVAVFSLLLACESGTPTETSSPFPPTGAYDISARVLADDCDPAWVAPAPWRQQVIAAAENGEAKVNVPLSAISPSTSTTSSARSDFRLQPGYTVEHRVTRASGCEDLAIDYVYTVEQSSASSFQIVVEAAYGDADACAPTIPTSCTTKVAYTYELVTSQCAAECTRGGHPVPSAKPSAETRWEIDCRCP